MMVVLRTTSRPPARRTGTTELVVSELREAETPGEQTYPYLGRYTGPESHPAPERTHFVVLFEQRNVGTVVQANPSAKWPVGHRGDDWFSPSFKPLNGAIVLSNS